MSVCPYPDSGPCHHRDPGNSCTRKAGEECLKPYRDGLKVSEDAKFVRECAALFRTGDPERAAKLDRTAERITR